MKFIKQIILGIVIVAYLTSCGTQKKLTTNSSISSLQLLHQYTIPYDLHFNETVVGGLSGIDYNPVKNEYYMICDDRSEKNPARYYTARINTTGEKMDTVIFTAVTFLKMKDGNLYPDSKHDAIKAPDPEALRYNAKAGSMVWSNEGERRVRENNFILSNPTVTNIQTDGSYIDSFMLPQNMKMTAAEKGPRRNGTFEGLTFDDRFKYLYVSVEEPIYDDGLQAGLNDSTGWTRIIKYDAAKRKPIAQYAYPLDAVAHSPSPAGAFRINGVTDILFVGKNKFITLERSYSTGRLGCSVKVYLTDISGATDISQLSLKDKPGFNPATKKLLLNMDSLGIFIDNIEGVTFGPTLPNGHKTLLFIADDNFAAYQFSQILLFEVIP